MEKYAYHLLHITIGITLLWMGLLIWQSPELFGSFLQPSFAEKIPDIKSMMQFVAVFDIFLGLLLIIGVWTWLFATVAALHFLGIVVGIGGFGDIVARDFGLMLAAVALALWGWSERVKMREKPKEKVQPE